MKDFNQEFLIKSSKMSNYKYLSHFLDHNTPIYGGGKGILIEDERSILNGDTANTKKIFLHNHSGTHVDFPNHFFKDGLKSNDYDANFWIFNTPFICKISVQGNELINLNEEELVKIPENVDFLIIKTGFEKFRNDKVYWSNNPGLDPNLADILRIRFKNLKVIGVDFISITSYQNRELGRTAHRNFLKNENTILLVEDMRLVDCDSQPEILFCFPLLISEIDGAPVTIIGKF
jgi:kynurenine formamidase